MKIRCMLVDDEPPAIRVLESHISSISGLEIVATCHNAVEALDVLDKKQVDLLFLDVKMPKMLGTSFLKSLPQPPKVIFVTAYRDFALEGYELDAVDYLLKPVSFERFVKAIVRYKKLAGQEISQSVKEYHRNEDAFIYLKVEREMKKVIVSDIWFIEGLKDYVKVNLKDGKFLIARHSITAMLGLLSEQRFIRVHRSFIVSLEKITGYKNNSIILGQQSIPIGRLYKQQVMQILQGRGA